MHDFINRIHDLEVFRTDFGNRQVQEVNHLIFPALLCLTALLYLASVLGGTEKQYEKPLFRVVIVQCAAHCEAVPMVN